MTTLEQVALAIDQTWRAGEIDFLQQSAFSARTSICVICLADHRKWRIKMETESWNLTPLILGTHPSLTATPTLVTNEQQTIPVIFVHERTKQFDKKLAQRLLRSFSNFYSGPGLTIEPIDWSQCYQTYKQQAIDAMVKKALAASPSRRSSLMTSFTVLVSDQVYEEACEQFIFQLLVNRCDIRVTRP